MGAVGDYALKSVLKDGKHKLYVERKYQHARATITDIFQSKLEFVIKRLLLVLTSETPTISDYESSKIINP